MEALIDADVLRYRCGFAAEKNYYDIYLKGEEEWGAYRTFLSKREATKWIDGEEDFFIKTRVVPEPVENCLHSVKLQIEYILKSVEADSYILYLTGKGNFREQVATIRDYKGNRPDRKPFHYRAITDYLVKVWGAVVVEGEEADDFLSKTQWEDLNAR